MTFMTMMNFLLQPDDAHYEQDGRAYLNENLQEHWLGRRGAVVSTHQCSPDLTHEDFYLKDVLYSRKNDYIDGP